MLRRNRFDQFCLEQGVPWSMREDPWVQAIFYCSLEGVDEQITRIEDIRFSEDFSKMNEERMQLYEKLLKIPFLVDNRRKVIQGFWSGWGKPSKSSVKEICSAICNINQSLIIVNFGLENNPSAPYIRVQITNPTALDPSLLFLCRLALRQHIPAHYGLHVFGDCFSFLTIEDMEGLQLKELAGKEGSQELWNFES